MTEYIKKQHLLEFFDSYIKEEEDKQAQMVAKNIKRAIKKMPSDKMVERKRGKWIEGNGVDYVRCGCCHKNYDWVSQAQYYNFCPNCGADMRGRDTE